MTAITGSAVQRAGATAVVYLNAAINVAGAYPLGFGQGIGAVRVLVALGLGVYDVAGLALCAGAAAVFRKFEATMGWAETAGSRAQQHLVSLKGRDLKQFGTGILEFTGLKFAVGLIMSNMRVTSPSTATPAKKSTPPNQGYRLGDDTKEARVDSTLVLSQKAEKYLQMAILVVPLVGTPLALVSLITHAGLAVFNSISYGCGCRGNKPADLQARIKKNLEEIVAAALFTVPGLWIPVLAIGGVVKFCCCPSQKTIKNITKNQE